MLKLLNPYFFTLQTNKLIKPLSILTIFLFITGLYQALISSPIDYQQKEIVRIMYIHVPSAWLALGIYSFIGICSFINIIWKIRICYLLSIAAAPIGTMFAFITLFTGSLWGKPMWGAWWVWDARLTSMLILFLTYVILLGIINSGDNILRSEKPAMGFALVGLINVPIVKFSVNMWYSLHQGASIVKLGGPSIHPSMLIPLLNMFIALISYSSILILLRMNILLIQLKNYDLRNYR